MDKRERERKEKEDDVLHLVKTYSTTFVEQIREAEKNVRLFENFQLIIDQLSYYR